jgi:ABC-type Fe3+-hydroxamate transport system substrate-binding protein
MEFKEIADIRGMPFKALIRPFRVVSLVPSWTETLFYLGLTEVELVGRTDYCIRPRARVDTVERLGGPKDPDLDRIFELDPDLIIMDKEENRKVDVERLDMHWGVSRAFLTGPTTVDQALSSVEEIGLLLNAENSAFELISDVRSLRKRLIKRDRGSVVYLTWQDPFIAATRETYIGDVLEVLGYKNILDRSSAEHFKKGGNEKYPVVDLELLARLRPEAIFLSTEPFPFRRKHIVRLRSEFRQRDTQYAEKVSIRIVNGEYFSWYGSRMIPAFRYFVKNQAHL